MKDIEQLKTMSSNYEKYLRNRAKYGLATDEALKARLDEENKRINEDFVKNRDIYLEFNRQKQNGNDKNLN